MVLELPLWSGQMEVAEAIVKDRRVTVRSGNALGKTVLLSLIAVWWTLARKDAVCVLVGPSATQLAAAAWGYIRQMIQQLKRLDVTVPSPTTAVGSLRWELSPGNYMLGLSTDRPERLSGYHAGGVLVLVDEASRLTDQFWNALWGLIAGGDSKIALVGNPLSTGGFFYDTHHKDRRLWSALHLDILKSPNFAGVVKDFKDLLDMSDAELDANPVPELATRRAVRDSLIDWTESSPLFDVRIRGDFPRQSEWALYPLPLLEARRAPCPPLAHDPDRITIGIDPAGAGRARTSMCVLHGANIVEMKHTRDPESMGIVLDWLRPWREKHPSVAVDMTGLGYGFAKVIRDAGYSTHEQHFGATADDPERFRFWRSEIAWKVRDALNDNALGSIPDTRECPLLAEMATLQYRPTTRDQNELEPKDKRQTRGLESPDLFDSLCLALGIRSRSIRGSYAFLDIGTGDSSIVDDWLAGRDLPP
jgi:phage terminase large subunit